MCKTPFGQPLDSDSPWFEVHFTPPWGFLISEGPSKTLFQPLPKDQKANQGPGLLRKPASLVKLLDNISRF